MTNGCRHDLFPCIDQIITTKIILSQSFLFFWVGGSSIHNLITNAYIPDNYVPHIINIHSTGQKFYKEYVLERINRYIMSLWDTVKKIKKILCIHLAIWNDCQSSEQECRSKGNDTLVLALDGPCFVNKITTVTIDAISHTLFKI